MELSNVGRVPSKAKPTLNQGKGSVKLVVVGDSKSHSKLSTPKSNLTTTNTDESRKNIRFKYGDLATMISSSFIIPTANSLSYKSASVLDSSSINFASHQKLFTAVTVQEYHLFANILDNVPLISINDALESLENKIRSCGSSLEMLLSVDITITDDESPVVNVNESSDSSTANREKINIKFRLRRNYYILIYLNVHNYLSISVLNSLIDKNDEALGYVQHALQYILPILGKKNLVIATIYCHLGCCFLQFNNDESNKKAITSFKKLLDVLNTLYSDSVHETRTRRRTTLTDKELFKAKPTSSNGNNLSLYGKKSSNSINGSIDVSIDEEDNMQTSGDIHVSDFCKIDKNKKFQEINVDTSGMYYIAALAFLKFEFVKEALQCFKMALLIQQEIYGKNHFVTITTCSHIGQVRR